MADIERRLSEAPQEVHDFIEKLRAFVTEQPFDRAEAREEFLRVHDEVKANPPDLSGDATIATSDQCGEFSEGDILTTSSGFWWVNEITSVDSATCMTVRKSGLWKQLRWWVGYIWDGLKEIWRVNRDEFWRAYHEARRKRDA